MRTSPLVYMMSDAKRYAIYFSPKPQSELGQFGEMWLGRTADRVACDGWQHPRNWNGQEHLGLTTKVRHYGFHGTLKAPFELSEKYSESDLIRGVQDLASSLKAFALPGLCMKQLSRFLALVPTGRHAQIEALHKEIVVQLDCFRKPLSDFDRQRYERVDLCEEQKSYLYEYGYPYIFEFFRFHLTLTGDLVPCEEEMYSQKLAQLTAPVVGKEIEVDTISLFMQESRSLPFTQIETFSLGGNND